MNNKVLVKIYVPNLDKSFDSFIPVNEVVWKIKKLLIKAISDIEGSSLNINKEYIMQNKITGKIYTNNEIIINTDIRNSTELLLIQK